MNRLCIVVPGKYPVPSIMGGAVEGLVTSFINENEIEKLFDIIVICAWAPNIEDYIKEYKYCKFYYIKTNFIFTKIINMVNYYIAKITGCIDFFTPTFHRKAKLILKQIDMEKILVEHGVYKHFEFLLEKLDKNELFLHIHGVGSNPDRATQQLYGNIIGVSDYVCEYWKNKYENSERVKFLTCYNGINENKFSQRISNELRNELRAKYGVNEEDFLVIYCGRIIDIKGVKELATAIFNLSDRKIKLMIVGSPDFKGKSKSNYLSSIVEIAKNSKEKIFFTGYVDNNELYQYYQMADLQVVPSLCEEGAGLVNIEGMMSGLPLLVTDSGGLPEYVSKDCSIVIKKKNALYDLRDKEVFIKELESNIVYLFENDKVRKNMGLNASKCAIKYTEKAYYKSLSDILCGR